MRTQLGTYCEQFDGTLRPVLQDLDVALEALEKASDQTPSKSLHVPLLELQHQLRALCDKVAEQQAYVLIFGPLKSGKSTLMNAIAASYVSEVSSLPAYPCLVFVRAGKQRALRRMAIAACCSHARARPNCAARAAGSCTRRVALPRGAPGDFAGRGRMHFYLFLRQTVVALAPPRQSGNFCSIPPGLVRPDPHARVAPLLSGCLHCSNAPRKCR